MLPGTIVLAGSWLLIVIVLVLDLVGILHRGTGFRWQATGLLIMFTAIDTRLLAHLPNQTGSPIGALEPATMPVVLAGLARRTTGS